MLVTGHKWGAVCVLYQGIELRVFLFAPHQDTQKEIIKAVLEFEHKLQTYRRTGAIEWYPPASSKELDRIHPFANKEEIELDSAVADLAQAILSSKATMREVEDAIEESERQIKIRLGDAERGRAGKYVISWPMRNFKAAAERVTPAKEAYSVRQSTLNIKELKS